MLRLISAALVSLSAATAIAAPAKARPVTWENCPKVVPFALPDARVTASWNDLQWELFSRNAWNTYCHGREQSFECRCADTFGGGPY